MDRLMTKAMSEGTLNFTYDSENHLMSMTNGSTSATIVYDGDGNRIAKTAGGVTTTYLVDDLNTTGYPQVFDELTGAAVTRTYAYGLQRIDQNQQISGTWTPSFYGYDGGGNVRQLISMAGAVTDSYEYDAFGNALVASGSTPNEFLYRGEQYDSDLGLYYLRARYYNPQTGRFVSRDPFDGFIRYPETLHKYLYTGGDPVNGMDPSGRLDLVTYGIKIEQSLTATVVLNTISCGIQLGLAATTGGLYETFGNDLPGGVSAAFGCLTVQVTATGTASVVLDAVSLAGCGYAMYQTYEAENNWFKEETNENLRNVAAGLVNTFGSCATALFAIAAEP
jgi:RHS repeat-associated protein